MRFVKEHHQQWDGGAITSPEFKSFVRKTRNEFRKVFGDLAENITINGGHFYFYGFLTRRSDGQIFYFSISDVRFFTGKAMLIRTAKGYEDFTGGHNQYIEVDENFEATMKDFLS